MKGLFLGNALWQLVGLADPISKLVLLVLLGMSVVCWTIFFYKLILLRIKREQMRQAIAALKISSSIQEIATIASEMAKTLPGHFLVYNLTYLKSLIQRVEQLPANTISREWEGVQQHIDQSAEEIMHQEERYMPFLYASAGVSTLIGLFGTVWGLIHAFVRISQMQSADIATVAPGIAEALITTMAGLLVAIPAFLMFQYLSVLIRQLEYQFSVVVDRYTLIVKQLFVQ